MFDIDEVDIENHWPNYQYQDFKYCWYGFKYEPVHI